MDFSFVNTEKGIPALLALLDPKYPQEVCDVIIKILDRLTAFPGTPHSFLEPLTCLAETHTRLNGFGLSTVIVSHLAHLDSPAKSHALHVLGNLLGNADYQFALCNVDVIQALSQALFDPKTRFDAVCNLSWIFSNKGTKQPNKHQLTCF